MSVLEAIVGSHREMAAADRRPLPRLLDDARRCPPARDFRAALAGPGVSVIAEVKRRSPSKGDLAPHLVAAVLAEAYQAGGAACLSVLTDERWFGGSPADLAEARAATTLPVLRKDFTVSDHDVCDARLMGADALLLIVAALDDAELTRFLALAADVGLAALVEVHDDSELDRAVAAGADVIGVNARDLRTFAVARERALRLRARIPAGTATVAESGIRDHADMAAVAAAGYDAVLVGESLVTAADPARAVEALTRGTR